MPLDDIHCGPLCHHPDIVDDVVMLVHMVLIFDILYYVPQAWYV